jgi:medium-chain acyl-[acyl-carrier-protein] hydrolase
MKRPSVERLSPWLLSIGSAIEASHRLICFPYAGGSANVFQRWAAHSVPAIQICAVELPGRGDRFVERPFDRMVDLIPPLADNLIPHLERPFAFFGHSLGALIAFELTHELVRRKALLPDHLFLSARRAPHLPSRRRLHHTLSEAEFMADLRTLGGTPREVIENEELMQLMSPLLRADFALAETYVCPAANPLEIPVQVFGGIDDTETLAEELHAWSIHTRYFRGVKCYRGGHFFLHGQEAELMSTLRASLAASRPPAP